MSIPAELSYTTCLARLRQEEVGRVAVCTSGGPRIVPVNYSVVDDDTLVFRTTPYSALGSNADGSGWRLRSTASTLNSAAGGVW